MDKCEAFDRLHIFEPPCFKVAYEEKDASFNGEFLRNVFDEIVPALNVYVGNMLNKPPAKFTTEQVLEAHCLGAFHFGGEATNEGFLVWMAYGTPDKWLPLVLMPFYEGSVQ